MKLRRLRFSWGGLRSVRKLHLQGGGKRIGLALLFVYKVVRMGRKIGQYSPFVHKKVVVSRVVLDLVEQVRSGMFEGIPRSVPSLVRIERISPHDYAGRYSFQLELYRKVRRREGSGG